MNLDEPDEFGSFSFKTTRFNSIRILCDYLAASDDLLSCLSLQFLRCKSTSQSYRTPIYYVDLTLREGVNLKKAITSAKQIDEQSKAPEFYQEALEHVVRQGYGNASF